jgi:hypothetical protein
MLGSLRSTSSAWPCTARSAEQRTRRNGRGFLCIAQLLPGCRMLFEANTCRRCGTVLLTRRGWPRLPRKGLRGWRGGCGSARSAGPSSLETDERNRNLFEAIPRRRTMREPFENRELPDELVHGLEQFAAREGAWLASRDGIPGYTFGMGNLFSRVGAFVLRRVNWGKYQARKDRELLSEHRCSPCSAPTATRRASGSPLAKRSATCFFAHAPKASRRRT